MASTQRTEAASTSSLPLVRLELFQPFVQELDRRALDADGLLLARGLQRASIDDPNLFVSVNLIHQLLEDCATLSDDPFFGIAVGEKLDITCWSPLVDAATRADTLGDFLTRFILAAANDANSVTLTLNVHGRHTFYSEQRISEPDITPAQNDAFTAGYVLAILKRATGKHWDADKILLQVCEPRALPDRYADVRVAGGDNRGMTVRFPTEWLTHTIDRERLIDGASVPVRYTHPPGSFLEALWLTLGTRLDSPDLSVDHVAGLLGLSRQTLQRRLKANDTSLTHEIAQLKQQRAIEALIHTDRPIADIGAMLGFNNPASFTRAFRAWTGAAPRDYRKQHGKGG